MAQRVVHQRAAKQRASVVHYQLRGERAQFRPSRDGVRYSSANVSILIENSAGIIIVNVKWNYNDVRLLSIEPVKKTNVEKTTSSEASVLSSDPRVMVSVIPLHREECFMNSVKLNHIWIVITLFRIDLTPDGRTQFRSLRDSVRYSSAQGEIFSESG